MSNQKTISVVIPALNEATQLARPKSSISIWLLTFRKVILKALSAFLLFACAIHAQAGNPYLAFSDLISGPSTGLGDGKGSGVVVTLWGQFLGDIDGDGSVTMVDVNANEHVVPIYYWKFADGSLPSGPANLHASHYMHEIAFSVPQMPNGAAEIYVKVNGLESNRLPFSVRDGQIHHIKSTGNDSGGNGLWNNPWRTINKALSQVPTGSTLYVHDVDTGDVDTDEYVTYLGIYWNRTVASSPLEAQLSVVAFPGYQPRVVAQRAVENYTTAGMVLSKFDIYASNYAEVDANGQFVVESRIASGETFGIRSSKNGRAIANRISDVPGGCASTFAGAISGGAKNIDRVSNFKAFGNEIYEYGCEGTTKFHHTTYLTVRSGVGLQVEPWEWGYNYLHDNHAKCGIHNYDENANCGNLTGPLLIHNNVIVNQGGAGISVGSNCGWSMDVEIENNVLINVGLAAAWDGIDITTADGHEGGGIAIRDAGPSGLLSTVRVRNNIIHGYSADGHPGQNNGCLAINGGGSSSVQIEWTRNICITQLNQPFVGFTNASESKLNNITGLNNYWVFTSDGMGPSVPGWDSMPILSHPSIVVENSRVLIFNDADVRENKRPTVGIMRDIYGNPRGSESEVGATVFFGLPSPPGLVRYGAQ